MAYTKTNWQDLPSQTTPINATNLNNIETGIEDNDKRLNGTSVAGDMVVESIRTKNMFDKNSMILNASLNAGNGELAYNNDFRTIYFKCKPNTTYTFSQSVTSNRYAVGITSDNNITLPKTLTIISTSSKTFTTQANTNYVFIMVTKVSDETSNIQDIFNSIQIEEGSIATTYTPYQNLNGVSQPITIYSGALQGTQSVTLSGVKRYLKVYFTYAKESSAQIITYEIDTLSGKNLIYGSGIGLSHDGTNALNYYVSESSYNKSNGLFTHTRAYWLVLPNTSNERNLNSGYIIYKIDTYN